MGKCIKKTSSILVLILLSASVYSATINVTEIMDDPTFANGRCSLREAISSANTDLAIDSCTAGSGADVIELPAGTYTLSIAGVSENANATGDLDIATDITINGADVETTTIDGDSIDRIFHLVADNVDLTINEITITNGQAPSGENGGAILMGDIGSSMGNATLTILGSTISNSRTLGTADDGGAITSKRLGDDCLDCTVTIAHSTLSGNTSADRGGAITNNGNTLTILNSTISGNTSDDDGGGIESTGSFGGFTCNNCTIANNTAGDGGGGIDRGSSAAFILHNTIVADNSSGAVLSVDCEATTNITANYTIIENIANCSIAAGTANQFGVDPQLMALADNGGPGTHTQEVTMGIAIDTGETTTGGCLMNDGTTVNAIDQREAPRAQGLGDGGTDCDIGAYEFDSTGTPVELVNFSIE